MKEKNRMEKKSNIKTEKKIRQTKYEMKEEQEKRQRRNKNIKEINKHD